MKFLDQCKEVMELLFEFQNDGNGTVFFEISGHTQQVNVRIYLPQWTPYSDPVFKDYLYLDEPEEDDWMNFRANITKFLKSHKKPETVT